MTSSNSQHNGSSSRSSHQLEPKTELALDLGQMQQIASLATVDPHIENWPICDFLISFFSSGFPLDKAIAYAKLRQPFCVNDLSMQTVLWDRRLCLRILDRIHVPTARRLEVNRDGGPKIASAELAQRLRAKIQLKLGGPENGTGGGDAKPSRVELLDDGETLSVDGVRLRKPFVEKPVSGEDHNLRIYFSKAQGGGGRKLFRKIGNKSSEVDPSIGIPRAITDQGSSYVYEELLRTDNSEDVKAYTVGTGYCHAETRTSPVVDGLVRRNMHGKEVRYITELNKEESAMAAKIADAFGQAICGFDLLRVGKKSYVIDVNGFSFVKDNDEYYDQCASILKNMFVREMQRRKGGAQQQIAESLRSLSSTTALKSGSHRSTFQMLRHRSPSLSKLVGHPRQDGQSHEALSSTMTASTIPMSSAKSVDRGALPQLPPVSVPNLDALPPALFSPRFVRDKTSDVAQTTGQGKPGQATVPAPKHSWKLKGMVAVIRHADRTPKQKFKFTFHTKPFIDLLRGHDEEVLLIGEAALGSVLDAVGEALKEGIEDVSKLKLLRNTLLKKGAWPGTKIQIKPIFRQRKSDQTDESPTSEGAGEAELSIRLKEAADGMEDSLAALPKDDELSRTPTASGAEPVVTFSRISAAEENLILDKLQLVMKWGGEPTHSARYQSQDLGENMRNDLQLMNREILKDVKIFSSSERRVNTSARIWASAFLDQQDVPDDYIVVRKDLLDDSNAAKDEMDKVKKKLKLLLRDGNEAPPQFAWPKETLPVPSIVLRHVVSLMNFHRKVMLHNFSRLSSGAASYLAALSRGSLGHGESGAKAQLGSEKGPALADIQARWCCQEDAELFRERWEKLFSEFCDTEKVDPSKISELYDTMKFDALHNRQFLEWVFTPTTEMLEEYVGLNQAARPPNHRPASQKSPSSSPADASTDKHEAVSSERRGSTSHRAPRIGLRRRSILNLSSSARAGHAEEAPESYFRLFAGSGETRAKLDHRLRNLRELYKLAKVLFDYVCPQEYGIEDGEKLKIGLLTSLPLLREIVSDLEELQASEQAKSFIYFTKESHVYTLLNCILEGGIQTKIQRKAIPELDFLSQICFELYESENKTPLDAPPEEPDTFDYSIRISISPGCHILDPLDLQLDARHCIGCAPRRSLTPHADWKQVIETLRAKFHTVKLPQSFLAVNLSEKVPDAFTSDRRGPGRLPLGEGALGGADIIAATKAAGHTATDEETSCLA
ncbi:MAG: hypothetical protein M1826_001295 [Phylliscum demangeonii]|nr:MAG: hypothetical protein M1826_001295 [Phylliscum demangeonii]